MDALDEASQQRMLLGEAVRVDDCGDVGGVFVFGPDEEWVEALDVAAEEGHASSVPLMSGSRQAG